jgi:PPP family 3-phenylpropionic acid transporter
MHGVDLGKRHQVALIAYLFLVTSTFGFLQPFSPLYLQAAGLDKGQIGLVFGLGSGIALLMQPIWGRLSDHFDTRRPFIIFSALCAGIAYLSFRGARDFGTFLALTALGSNGIMYLNAVGGVLIGRLVQSQRAGAAYAGYRLWGSVGYIVVTLTTGLLLNPQGKALDRQVLDMVFTYGPLLFFAIAGIALLLPDFRRATRSEPVSRPPVTTNLKWFLVSYFLYIFSLYGASNFLSLYMKQVGGSSLWITAMFAGGVICEVMVMRLSGRFSDKYGRRPLLALTFILLPLRLAMYIAAFSPLGVFAIQLLHGFNFGIMGAISVALINDLATDETRGQAQARLAMVAGFASSTAPIVLGRIAELSGLRAMFGFAALLASAGCGIFLLKVQETHHDSRPLVDRLPRRWAALWRLLDSPP